MNWILENFFENIIVRKYLQIFFFLSFIIEGDSLNCQKELGNNTSHLLHATGDI
jgi:hypothetical protein